MISSLALLTSLAVGHLPAVADTPFVDQHGATDRLSAHRGHTVVAFVVSARRLREVEAWEVALRDRFDDLTFLRVADVDEDREVSHADVAAKLLKRVPEDVSILIDVRRRWYQELQLDTSHTNVLVFDEDGALYRAFHGKRNDERLRQVVAAIDTLRSNP